MLPDKTSEPMTINPELSDQKRSSLGENFARLQRDLAETDRSMLIIVDGWESSGRGFLLNDLARELDPKLYEVESFGEETEDDRSHHRMYRFMKRSPMHGHIAIYDRSFYYDLFSDYDYDEEELDHLIEDISFLEKIFVQDDTLIVKFFLHQSEEEMGRRMGKLEEDPFRNFLVSHRDEKQLEHYDEFYESFNGILEKTNFETSPWHVLHIEGEKDRSRQALQICTEALSKFLDQDTVRPEPEPIQQTEDWWSINDFDLSPSITDEEYDQLKGELQAQAGNLLYQCAREGKRIVVAYEGTDAAGKGGNIKRLTRLMDPRAFDVSTTSSPTKKELAHHYLWRFNEDLPHDGFMTIFDRTWYGRVLVERVEALTPNYRWKEAYEEINQMEHNLVHQDILVLKYLILIDADEQLDRFEDRAEDPDKQHKLTDEDWRNHKVFDDYKVAMEDMVNYTSTPKAPWEVVAGTSKKYARIHVLKDFVRRVDDYLNQ